MFSVGLMLRLDSATLDYRQTVAGLTLGGFKMAYIKIQDQVLLFLKVLILVNRVLKLAFTVG